MQVVLKIQRFNPEQDSRPHWEEYEVEVEPTDRLLDALHLVKWYQDGTLTFRRSCAHGVCGSDAMTVNHVNRLACKVLMMDLGSKVTVEALRGFPIVKDLVVDMAPFFDKYRIVKPYLIMYEPAPAVERYQSREDRAKIDDTTRCILCGACTSACPSFWANAEYVGPAVSSSPTALSLTAAIKEPMSGLKSSTTGMVSGAAGPFSTVWGLARARSM